MYLAFSAIAARSHASPARWRRPFLIWMDGVEAGWAVPLLLSGFVVVWLAFLMIAYAGGDLHPDVLETWTLGRSLAWGYSKHPPLMGWVAGAWTSVFPLANWSLQLMALVNAAIALWAVDLISRRFVTGDRRIIVLLLLMLLPVYQFYAQRFNANAILLPLWPIATYCFLRSFETREIRWAVAAGAAAALAMLGKYYSVFLIFSFAVAAFCHPQRRAYFRSSAPWISIATGGAALLPHLHWLVVTGAPPFAYALARHTGKAFGASLIEAFLFILGLAAVLAIAVVTWALMAQGRAKDSSRDFQAMSPGLLLLFLIAVGTIVFPAITSVGLGTDMPPIWGLQGLFLFVIVMVCGARGQVERFYSVNLAALVIGVAAIAVVVAAPLHAVYRNSHPLHEGRNFYQLAAQELTAQWHAQSDAALTAVGGDDGLAFALAFYSPDHPLYEQRLVVPYTDALPGQTAFEQGWAALCYGEDAGCIAAIERVAVRAPRLVKSEFVLQSTLLGQPGATQRFAAFLVPPAEANRIAPPPSPGIAEDVSEVAAVTARPDGATCCAPGPSADGDEPRAELPLRPMLATDAKPVRRAAPAARVYSVNWPDRTGVPASHDGFARWPVPSPPRTRPPAATRGSGAPPAFGACHGGRGGADRHGSKRTQPPASQPLSVRLRRQFCAMAAEMRASQQRFDLFMSAARQDFDRKLQLWRKDHMRDGSPDSQRRRI